LDLKYFSFSNPNLKPKPTHLPKALIISFLSIIDT